MLLSDVSVLVVAQSSSEIPEGLTNNPVYVDCVLFVLDRKFILFTFRICVKSACQ